MVGGTLGGKWVAKGHSVVFGTRTGETSVRDAARQSDVVVLAVRWSGMEQAIVDCGSLAGKIVIDPSLPLLEDFSGLSVDTTTSGGETVAEWARGAKVVKAFNQMGAEIMANPAFGEAKAAAFYCGDDAGAKVVVGNLIADLGFEPVDAGPLRMARFTEPLGYLWISLAHTQGLGRGVAFNLLRR